MMARSSFLPVCEVMDRLRSMSFSFRMPSGVSSKAQAKISAGIKPIARTMTVAPITVTAMVRGKGLDVVLCHALALAVHDTEVVLGVGDTLLRSLPEPLRRLCVALRHALALAVLDTEVELSFGVTLWPRVSRVPAAAEALNCRVTMPTATINTASSPRLMAGGIKPRWKATENRLDSRAATNTPSGR